MLTPLIKKKLPLAFRTSSKKEMNNISRKSGFPRVSLCAMAQRVMEEKRVGKSRILKCKKNITDGGVIIRTVKMFEGILKGLTKIHIQSKFPNSLCLARI